MTTVTHMVTGLVITQAVANPYISLPLAFASHFALDAIPHNDYAYNLGGNNWVHIHESPLSMILLGFSVALCFYLAHTTPTPLLAFSGSILGVLPDIIASLTKRLGYKNNPFRRFHSYWHSAFDLGEFFYNQWGSGKKVHSPRNTKEYKTNFQLLSKTYSAKLGWLLEAMLELAFLLILLTLLIYY